MGSFPVARSVSYFAPVYIKLDTIQCGMCVRLVYLDIFRISIVILLLLLLLCVRVCPQFIQLVLLQDGQVNEILDFYRVCVRLPSGTE